VQLSQCDSCCSYNRCTSSEESGLKRYRPSRAGWEDLADQFGELRPPPDIAAHHDLGRIDHGR